MSGGTFDYNQYRLEDAIRIIEDRISDNGKTLKQIWEERGENMSDCAAGWFKPWTVLDHPYYLDDNASDAAYDAIGYPRETSFSSLTQIEMEDWNKIRRKELKRLLDEHNNSTDGPVYSKKTISQFKKGIDAIRKALVYLNRIDYLLAGDDGEDSFHERLKEELDALKKEDKR